jgi:flavorubredoxin
MYWRRAMRALLIYESMFGNTKRIAEAVADGITEHLAVELTEVSMAPAAVHPAVDLLVVGGPTHVHGMTSAFTRTQAEKQSMLPLVSAKTGAREWLEQLRSTVQATNAATFDTRVKGAEILTGSAANGYAKRLTHAGFQVMTEPESFFIATKAPQGDALLPGELERARAWGCELGLQVVRKVAVPVA